MWIILAAYLLLGNIFLSFDDEGYVAIAATVFQLAAFVIFWNIIDKKKEIGER